MAYISIILALSLFFVALSIESKKIKVLTWALVIPYCWLMISLSRSVSRWVNIRKSSSEVGAVVEVIQTGNIIDQVVFSTIFIICCIILFGRREKLFEIFKNNKTWLLLYIYCALSIFWSDFAFISTKRYIKDLNALLVALVILTEPAPIEAFKAIVRRNMYLLVPLSIALCKYFPYVGRHQHHGGSLTYSGVATSKNSLGMLCLIGGLFFLTDIWNIWKSRQVSSQRGLFYLYCFYFILILYLFTFANSITSLVSFLIASIILVSSFLKKNLRKIVIIVAVTYLGLGGLLFDTLNVFLGVVERDLTLTGRIFLWETLLGMDFNSTLGTGYNSFWLGDRLVELWNLFAFKPKQAHNGYIEVYINLGIVGLSLLGFAILRSSIKITHKVCADDNFWPLQFSCFYIFLLYNITEATVLFNTTPIWFIFLFMVLHLPQRIYGRSDEDIEHDRNKTL